MDLNLPTLQDVENLLDDRLAVIDARLDLLITACLIPDVVYVSDIAKVERLSVTGIKKSPWLLPNFGVSDYPDGRTRWQMDTYRRWKRIPVKTRKKEWERLSTETH